MSPYVQMWSEEMDAALREGVESGLSFGQIALKISAMTGVPMTRNAPIGRANRLKIIRPNVERAKITRAFYTTRMNERRAKSAKPKPAPIVKPPKFKPDAPPIPEHNDVARVSFAGLEDHHCRWPVGEPGEPGFGFCGDQKVPGQSYCAGHCARAFTSAVTPMRKGEAKVTVGDTTLAATAEEFLQPA